MLWVVRRLFHAMFATPAAPVAADVSAASLFFKDLEERQQRRGLLRCLHAVCGTTADKCGHLPELRAHAVTKSRSHTGERESAADRPDMHQHFGYLDGIHVISDAFMLTGLQTLARAGAIAVLVPFPVSLDIHTAYTESGNGSGYCEYEAECSVSVRLDPKSCRVFRLK